LLVAIPLGDTSEDTERWWQAYQLAESDQAAELRQRAEAGDAHARRQLASWLSDRAKTDEAIETIRPLADVGDELAQLWLARWLADGNHIGELRERAARGSSPALEELAGWLAGHQSLDDVRELAARHRDELAGWLARQGATGDIKLASLAADLGDSDARERAEGWLARLRERAAAGSEYAPQDLAEWQE
jgi:hypothetical protein